MMNYGFPGYYQPMLNAQQRIEQFNQQYPQFTPQQPVQQQAPQVQQTPQVQNFPAISVATIEEAKAYIVDINGTPTFFYNAGKNEIYLKKTNKDTGAADFFVFERAEEPVGDVKQETGINPYEKEFGTLNDKIDGLYSLLKEKPQEIEQSVNKGGKNVK